MTENAPLLDKARGILRSGRRCIVNPDIDGLLSAMVLRTALGWSLAGWYDSKKTLLVSAEAAHDVDDCVYIDVFVTPPHIACIDQHIIALDAAHCATLQTNAQKVNPNTERVRCALGTGAQAYRWKYPFGSVHFIIAILESLGHEVQVRLDAPVFGDLTFADVLLRADDAARTTAGRYVENAADWWAWLTELGGPMTASIAETALAQSLAETERAAEVLEQQFRAFGCTTADGGFGAPLRRTRAVGVDTIRLIQELAVASGLEVLDPPTEYVALAGVTARLESNDGPVFAGLIEDPAVFSYAFVATRMLSFTRDMPVAAHVGRH